MDPTRTALAAVTVENPAPSLSSISPTVVDAGSPDTALTVTGERFTSQSKVHLGDASLETNFVSSTQLTAVAVAAQLTTAGGYPVTVATASPGGGTSDAVNLTVRVVAEGRPRPKEDLHAKPLRPNAGGIEREIDPTLLAGIIAGAVVLLGVGYYVFRPKRDGQRLKRAGISFNAMRDLGRQQLEVPDSRDFTLDIRIALIRSEGETTAEAGGPLVTGEKVVHE